MADEPILGSFLLTLRMGSCTIPFGPDRTRMRPGLFLSGLGLQSIPDHVSEPHPLLAIEAL
jgi:hypothetical protein